MIVIPRYEPVFVEPNLKEYETQVLEMSVPIDEMADDGTFARKNRRKSSSEHFSLDSISYITKDRMSYRGGGGGGGNGSSSSPATSDHTRTTAATHRAMEMEGAVSAHYSSLDDGDDDPITPIRNPLFTR